MVCVSVSLGFFLVFSSAYFYWHFCLYLSLLPLSICMYVCLSRFVRLCVSLDWYACVYVSLLVCLSVYLSLFVFQRVSFEVCLCEITWIWRGLESKNKWGTHRKMYEITRRNLCINTEHKQTLKQPLNNKRTRISI